MILALLIQGAQMALVLALAPLLTGLVRKVKARLQRRRGPRCNVKGQIAVGPFADREGFCQSLACRRIEGMKGGLACCLLPLAVNQYLSRFHS